MSREPLGMSHVLQDSTAHHPRLRKNTHKKMKHVGYFILFLYAFLLTACVDSNSYAKSLEAEKELVEAYIKREQINILPEIPEDGVWGEKDYVEIDDYLYFHLSAVGDTASTDSVEYGMEINLRYRRYTLDVYADTVSYWTTADAPNPISFRYGNSSSNVCSGWLKALPYMKYNNSEAKIICPSKMGFSEEQSSVTPYGYDLKIQLKNF